MRNCAYLSRSRHGVFYFRWPLAPATHPQRLRTDVKLSLGTRCPRMALILARRLIGTAAGGIPGAVRHMRYNEVRQHVRQHFQDRLAAFKEQIAEEGLPGERALEAMQNSQGLDRADLLGAVASGYPDGETGLLRAFLSRRGVTEDVPAEQRDMILREYHSGFQAYLRDAMAHLTTFTDYDLAAPVHPRRDLHAEVPAAPVAGEPAAPFAASVEAYLAEGRSSNLWVAKTLSTKTEELRLLGELTGDRPLCDLKRLDARKVKEVLLRLPKNRSKMPNTRDLSLADALKLAGTEVIATQTVNGYINTYKAFFGWAVDNGLATENLFAGMSVKTSRRTATKRPAFTAAQLAAMLAHLIDSESTLVNRECHRWGTLVAMFTGCRVNEAAQLHVADIRQEQGIWCIDFNENDGKSVKTAASTRIVPIHWRLLDAGSLEFVESRRIAVSPRLFPEFSFTPQNGYGRNLGRWFNDTFLPELDLKSGGLVFHSLRHSMVTLLGQADVPLTFVSAIVGHEQSGVTQQTYFNAGFTLEQLQRRVNQFTF